MKTSRLSSRVGLISLVTAAAAALSASAFAADVTVTTRADDNIIVTAPPLPHRAPVAVSGTVIGSEGKSLLLQRPDGIVEARLDEPSDPLDFYAGRFSSQFDRGQPVTVFGRINQDTTGMKVNGEAVLDRTQGKLIMLDSFAARLHSTSPHAVARALENYTGL